MKAVADRHQIDVKWVSPAGEQLAALSDAEFERFVAEQFEPRLEVLHGWEVSAIIVHSWFRE